MNEKITIGDISIDCRDAEKLRDFYANFIGGESCVMYNCPALVASNSLVILFMPCDFEYVPPVWPEEPGKQQKQMHFNFGVDDLASAVEEALNLGAVKPTEQYGGNQFVTLLDPEGHPFCLCRKQEELMRFMERDYTGVVVEESFDDNRLINDLNVKKVYITGHPNPKDRWHMYEVLVSKDEIFKLSEHMVDTWYMHFWKDSDIIAVFSGNNVFEFKYDDKSTWGDVLEYGRKAGLPEEQLDFPIIGL